jgi:hypothetical protein
VLCNESSSRSRSGQARTPLRRASPLSRWISASANAYRRAAVCAASRR